MRLLADLGKNSKGQLIKHKLRRENAFFDTKVRDHALQRAHALMANSSSWFQECCLDRGTLLPDRIRKKTQSKSKINSCLSWKALNSYQPRARE